MPLNDSPLDATIHVVTPENIAFEYRLAGPFRRLPAFLLDFCIGTAIFIGLVIVIGLMISPTSGSLAAAEAWSRVMNPSRTIVPSTVLRRARVASFCRTGE